MFPFAEEPGASRFRVMQLSTTDHVPCIRAREKENNIIRINNFHYAVHDKLKTFCITSQETFQMLMVHFMNTIKYQDSDYNYNIHVHVQ